MKSSIYFKNFISTAALVIVSFLMLGIAFLFFGRNYLINEYRDSMDRNADEVVRAAAALSMKMMSSYSSIEGIGFAIPTSGIKTVADQLLTGGGVTGRPSIGITVAAVSDIVSEHYKIPGGLYISAVAKGSDAEKQGVKKGDILTAVNGTAVTTTDDVNDIKNSLKVGDTIKLTVWRDDKTLDFNVKLVESSDIYGG